MGSIVQVQMEQEWGGSKRQGWIRKTGLRLISTSRNNEHAAKDKQTAHKQMLS